MIVSLLMCKRVLAVDGGRREEEIRCWCTLSCRHGWVRLKKSHSYDERADQLPLVLLEKKPDVKLSELRRVCKPNQPQSGLFCSTFREVSKFQCTNVPYPAADDNSKRIIWILSHRHNYKKHYIWF